MSVSSEISRIKANISNAYTACGNKGATLPQTQNSANLAATINAISAGVEAEALSWVQTSEAVRNYLANVTYDPSDYTTSQIANYAPATAAAANHIPAGKTISVSAGRLDRSGYVQTVAAGSVTVYNDIPNAKTPFTVDNNGAVSKTGTLNPTHFLRQIKCVSTDNVRDLGGWACDGGHVKYGKLIRGGNPSAYDAEVLVDQCGVKHEMDLRGKTEAGKEYSILGGDIGYSVFDNYAWYTISDTVLWKQMIRVVFNCIAANEPIYFHCAAGADRTGTLACVLEALLGMPQSDIDKDYELTSFYTGTGSDSAARRRNEAEWSGLINALNAKTGNTFRDKAVRFILELGFTIDEINAFRAQMIDGTPEVLTANLETYSVTNSLSNVANSNTAQNATQFQEYEAMITPIGEKVINYVRITMGGVDITNKVFSGDETLLRYSVNCSLTHCSIDNTKRSVISGEGYGATITAENGYTLEGATVIINMGGNDVSTFYSNGKIAIPQVTGAISITINAVETALPYTNWIKKTVTEINGSNIYNTVGYKDGYRYNSSGVEVAASNCFTTGYIRVVKGDVVRFYGDIFSGNTSGTSSGFYKSDGTRQMLVTPADFYDGNYQNVGAITARMENIVYDNTTHTLQSFKWKADYEIWIKFSFPCSYSSAAIITINEEII